MTYKWTVDYFASCYECIHLDDYHICTKALKEVKDIQSIPSWCPLPDYNESDWVD